MRDISDENLKKALLIAENAGDQTKAATIRKEFARRGKPIGEDTIQDENTLLTDVLGVATGLEEGGIDDQEADGDGGNWDAPSDPDSDS